MMRRFRDRPLHSKLTVIIMVTCCTALVLGYAALAWRYAVGEQHKLVRHLEIVADVTGANTISALAFDDAAWVRRHLQSLQADPLVVAAAVYDQRGTMFASFQARAAEGADAASTVRVSRALLLDGEPLGSIAVDGDARQLHSALLADALIMSVIVMATGLVSWALATRLQRLVSEPIARLARTMERVATSRDYSQRVEPSGHDEVGMLIGSFNEMLDQIESRDRRSRIAAAQLEHLAHHDALTQLPNRTLFRIRLQQALGEADRQPQRVGVMFVDLDRFKTINDSLGHAVGDLLLQEAAGRISESVRETDVVARLGGDEFAVLLNGIRSASDAARIASKLVEQLARPFRIAEQDLFISASVGICRGSESAKDVETLLKNADAAMYRAKEGGRNDYRFFSTEMSADATESLTMTNGLAHALDNGEFAVHYQPRIELATRRVTGVEALVRWQHPVHGLIPPARFIPVAEASGMIEPIGDWVLATACRQARAWSDAGLGEVQVAVNFSARQFRHADFPEHVASILRRSGLPMQRLEVELTETLMMADHDKTQHVLSALKAMGASLAMDDFGTGYSSLSYLKRFPLDRLKIDQSFVRGLPANQHDLQITKAIVALAKSLNLRLVAEGVETPQQCDVVQQLGCEEAQGYLFGAPMPAADMARFLAAHQCVGDLVTGS